MQTRNLKYTANNDVNMEIDHPVYGWIPFTASPNDTEQLGKDLYAEAIAGTLGTIAAYVAPVIKPIPNPTGFAQSVKTGMGGILAANALMEIYPAFFPAIQTGQWADVQTLILDAQTKGVLNSTQYAEIKQAASDNHIPVAL